LTFSNCISPYPTYPIHPCHPNPPPRPQTQRPHQKRNWSPTQPSYTKKQPGKSHDGQFAILDNQTTSIKSKSVLKAFQQALVKAHCRQEDEPTDIGTRSECETARIFGFGEGGKMVGAGKGELHQLKRVIKNVSNELSQRM
jgi:hypothetical protein